MNAERLLELADLLVDANNQFEMQPRLQNLKNALDNLASNPGDPNFQNDVVQARSALETAHSNFIETLTPARIEAFWEMGARPYFGTELPLGLQALLQTNSVTPAATRDYVSRLLQERQEFLTALGDTSRSLRKLQIYSEPLEPGTAEIGFQIPRSIFQNHLSGLANEFSTINRILAVFSEVATGSIPPVEVKLISTSDPLLFLGYDVKSLALLAGAITWTLSTIKQGLGLRDIVQKGQKEGLPKDLTEKIKEHAESVVKAAIDEKAKQLVESGVIDDKGRSAELTNGLVWSLNQLLARVERGMTIEIRILSPPPVQNDTPNKEEIERQKLFQEVEAQAKKLEFPRMTGEPLVQLRAPDNESSESGDSAPTDDHQ